MKTYTNPNRIKSIFPQLFTGLLIVILILGHTIQAEELFISDERDISDLDMEKLYIQEMPRLPDYVDTDNHRQLSIQNIRMTTITYNIDTSDCTLFKGTDGYDDLAIRGLQCVIDPGQPRLPMKTITVKLPKNAEVLGIEIEGGSYREILNTVTLAKSPEPYIWMRQEDIPEQINKKRELALAESVMTDQDNYFPGKIATYDSGRDNDATYISIKAFPVQYIPKSKKAVLITNVTINVYYSLPTSYAKTLVSRRRPEYAECVIICPALLTQAAEQLKAFHEQQENVSTSVVTTEDIDATCSPAGNPPFTGYSGNHTGKDKIVDYKYSLAKKIIAYLRDQRLHPNLKYVVLFGDGQLVPPSYYINEWAVYEWYSWTSYEDWIPTDFLYTSPDYDYVPNYKVGRLPVSDVDQAVSMVRKIERWHNSLSWDWFKRVSVVGGRPFGSMLYYGELGTVDVINRDLFNGMEISKYYYTDRTLDVAHVKPLFTTESTGLFFHIDHGSGYKLWLEDESICAVDIIDSSSPRYPLANPQAPIVVSVSCLNGAYDTDMTNFDNQPDFPEIPYPTSFGESVVLSNAGGIVYIGGSRLNYAGWNTSFDQGRLSTDHYYMIEICSSVFESYHNGASRIGDMTYDALKNYTQENNMEYSTNRKTVFGFVLLGDPVLSVPTQQPGVTCPKPYLTATKPDGFSEENIPTYKDLPLNQSQSISIVTDSDSPVIDVKSINVWSNTMISGSSLNTLSPTYMFTPNGCGYHLVRSSTADGKEGWLYLNAQYEFVPTSKVLLIDGDYGEDYESYYTDTLDRLGRTYDVWEAGARDPVDAQTLTHYLDGVVIWTIPFSYPDGQEKMAFESYLDNGGRLFITGQDIGYWLTDNGYETDDFYQNYLHAQYIKDDSQVHTLSGTSNDPIGNGLTFSIWGGDGANNQYWPDEIEAISPAIPIFTYEEGGEGAIRVDTGTYKVVYFSFGFEGIDFQADRDNVMKRVLDWLRPSSQ